MFACEKCGNTFSSKYNLERHVNRKTPCEPIIEKKRELDFSCVYCNREFSRKQNLRRHMNSCSVYNGGNIRKELIAKFVIERDKKWKKKYKEMEKKKDEKIVELEKRLNQLAEKRGDININNQQTTINDSHNVDNSINIHFHGKTGPDDFGILKMRPLLNAIMKSKGIKSIGAKNAKNEVLRSFKNNSQHTSRRTSYSK